MRTDTVTGWLTEDELTALRAYAARHGRTWKADLQQAWMTGNYWDSDDSGSLQRLRNREFFGPKGLKNFRFPKG